MMVNKKMRAESLKFLNGDKPTYSHADRIVYSANIKRLGVKIIKQPHPLKIAFGGVLVMVGVLTFPIPCGSVFMIGVGCGFLVDGGVNLWKYYGKAKRKTDLFLFGVGLL